jgi:hypothetical protein
MCPDTSVTRVPGLHRPPGNREPLTPPSRDLRTPPRINVAQPRHEVELLAIIASDRPMDSQSIVGPLQSKSG